MHAERSFRYASPGRWYKGNTHIHSRVSDGGQAFAELARMYAGRGYHFLFRTDHWVASDVGRDADSHPLLWLDGVELDGADHTGAYFHVVCLGRFEGIAREMGLAAAMQRCRAQGGHLILAHPHWSGNTLDDARRWGFDGVEVYNHVCQWLNGKGDSLVHWNAMLKHTPGTLGFATDDAHVRAEHPGWDGAWIVVNAPAGTPEALLSAIRAGRFYSSCGPELQSLACDGNRVHIRCSPVQFVRLVGPDSAGVRLGSFDGRRLTEATLEVPPDWPYVYLEVEDDRRRRAWTNTLFVAGPATGA